MSPIRILIVDDNKAIHDDIKKVLAPPDAAADELANLGADLFGEDKPASTKAKSALTFDIDSAFQGQEALTMVNAACAEGRPYALAFVDVRMPPGWDGVETVGHLWQRDPALQVVLCTAYSDYDWNGISEKVETADRLVILRKPFDNIEVLQLAHALTRKWQVQRELEGRLANLEQLVAERTKALSDAYAQREQMEVQLRLSQKLESVGRLANGIAHEMNTPLQYVVTNLAFLKGALDDVQHLVTAYASARQALEANGAASSSLFAGVVAAEANADAQLFAQDMPQAFAAVTDGLERMSGLVKSMKEFAQPEENNRCATDINDALQTTLTIAREEWQRVADVELDLAADLPPVLCMRSEMNQVFLNLITNAAHAVADKVGTSGQRGVIRVRTQVDASGGVVVTIADTGTGIHDDVRDKIFDPFFTTKEVGRGSGQGLAIVWNVLEKHDGKITFDTVVGKGSTFQVRLRSSSLPAARTKSAPRTPAFASIAGGAA
jgi:two-component system, NtrC family, sensor kinase